MIRLRVEGTEEEIQEFLERLPEVPGYERTYVREPKQGNNPKYNNKNVLSYLTYEKRKHTSI
ncbi:DUF3970 family protein [Microbacteriaceae bacterium 4G12]